MKFYKSHFGRKLKAALKASGLKQRQLAEARGVDVDQSAVSRWVSGEDMPDDIRLPAIAEALGVDSNYFEVDGLAPDFGPAGEFLSRFASLPVPYQKVILALIYKDPTRVRGLSDKIGKPVQALLSVL
jgi:transcriptional regulator with XRE-family HTH domain